MYIYKYTMMQVIKRDNSSENFDINKIKNVLELAFKNSNTTCSNMDEIIDFINKELVGNDSINIEVIQDIVEKTLMVYNYYDTAKHYIGYRNKRNEERKTQSYISKIPDNIITPWGMLGFITYKRTYARRLNDEDDEDDSTEEFNQTIKRVLDASQKQLNVGFTNEELKNAYNYFMSLKCSVAGRFLWQLGTETVSKLGIMSLQNCAFVKIDDPIKPFTWIFDVLMLGTGVGFNIQKHNIEKIPIVINNDIKITRKDTKDADFIVPDSREGWVSLLEKVLEAFFIKGKSFSYSTILIRSAGTKIKGFGGTASGPEDLVKGINNIQTILKNKKGKKLSSVDCLDIVNIIASVVVAGNVRRSALIAIGDCDDKEYLMAKRWDLGIPNWRCMSNNSVVCDDITKLPDEFWEGYKGNGEPYGLINIELSKKIGRVKDGEKYPDLDVEGYNPCFHGDTLIAVADGRGAVPIKQLAEEGKDIPVYSVNEEGMVEIKWGRNPRITGENQKLVKVILDDNSYIKTTLNHKFRLNDGDIVEAKDLKPRMSLTRFEKVSAKVKKEDNSRYIRVKTNTLNSQKDQIFEHRLIANFFNPDKFNGLYDSKVKNGLIRGNVVVHHKDYNGLNNTPENLEIMSFKEHAKLHGDCDQNGENNGMYGKKHSDDTKKLIGEKTIERNKDPNFKLKQSQGIKKAYEERPELRNILAETQHKEYLKWCEKACESTDLETSFVNSILHVKKCCENCKKEFVIPFIKREQAYCSNECSNTSKLVIENRRQSRNKTLKEQQKKILHNQIMIYKDLEEELKRDPLKKEWENKCREQKVQFRIRNGISYNPNNEYLLSSYQDLKDRAKDYNHRVKSIEFLDETDTVYNITVDDNHTVGVLTNWNKDWMTGNGVFTPQCGEQSLSNSETCCLSEIFLPNITSFDELKDVATTVYRICKHSLLLKCHQEDTERIVHKNMRMGIGITGYMQCTQEQKDWLDPLYTYLREYDVMYSKKIGCVESIKLTTCKPSGTLSILPGVTPGAHPGIYQYFIRRIRISSTSNLINICKKHGYYVEYQRNFDGTDDKNTMVVEFPCRYPDGTKLAKDMTAIDQLETIKELQYKWSDNAVSVTIYYRLNELDDIKEWLKKNYTLNIKSCSFLLHNEHGFAQAPYEEITEDKYNELIKKVVPITSGNINTEDDTQLEECKGGICPIK